MRIEERWNPKQSLLKSFFFTSFRWNIYKSTNEQVWRWITYVRNSRIGRMQAHSPFSFVGSLLLHKNEEESRMKLCCKEEMMKTFIRKDKITTWNRERKSLRRRWTTTTVLRSECESLKRRKTIKPAKYKRSVRINRWPPKQTTRNVVNDARLAQRLNKEVKELNPQLRQTNLKDGN